MKDYSNKSVRKSANINRNSENCSLEILAPSFHTHKQNIHAFYHIYSRDAHQCVTKEIVIIFNKPRPHINARVIFARSPHTFIYIYILQNAVSCAVCLCVGNPYRELSAEVYSSSDTFPADCARSLFDCNTEFWPLQQQKNCVSRRFVRPFFFERFDAQTGALQQQQDYSIYWLSDQNIHPRRSSISIAVFRWRWTASSTTSSCILRWTVRTVHWRPFPKW